jgi:hypothetical protein
MGIPFYRENQCRPGREAGVVREDGAGRARSVVMPVVKRRLKASCSAPGATYDGDELEFLRAMDAYKRRTGRQFPACSEVLGVLKGLGYRKVEVGDGGGSGDGVVAAGEPAGGPVHDGPVVVAGAGRAAGPGRGRGRGRAGAVKGTGS